MIENAQGAEFESQLELLGRNTLVAGVLTTIVR